MSDELQTEVIDQPEVNQELQSDTATDTGENQEQKTAPIDAKQRAINVQAMEARTQRREKEALQKQLDELKANQPQQTRPEDPAVIDRYDDDYEVKTAARDKVIREQAAFDSAQAVHQQQKQAVLQQKQIQQQQVLAESIQSYTDRAVTLGVGKQDLQAAGNTINQFGLDMQLQQHILGDEQGPLIAKYLADNPQEMLNLSALTPMQAAVMIESQIKPKATATGKQTLAPEPTELLQGGGAPPGKRGPSGATYE